MNILVQSIYGVTRVEKLWYANISNRKPLPILTINIRYSAGTWIRSLSFSTPGKCVNIKKNSELKSAILHLKNYAHICVCVWVWVCRYTCMYTHVYVLSYTYIFKVIGWILSSLFFPCFFLSFTFCLSVCLSVSLSLSIYIYMCVCVCVCVHTNTCMNTYVYIHICAFQGNCVGSMCENAFDTIHRCISKLAHESLCLCVCVCVCVCG